MTTIDPGPGFRLLAPQEVLRNDDHVRLLDGEWGRAVPGPPVAPCAHRRAIRPVEHAPGFRWLDAGEILLADDEYQGHLASTRGRPMESHVGSALRADAGFESDNGPRLFGWSRAVAAPAQPIHRTVTHGALCGAQDLVGDVLTPDNARVTCTACRDIAKRIRRGLRGRDRDVLALVRTHRVERAPIHFGTFDAKGLVFACEAVDLTPAGRDQLSLAPFRKLTCIPCIALIEAVRAEIEASRAAWDAEMAASEPAPILAPIDHEDFV